MNWKPDYRHQLGSKEENKSVLAIQRRIARQIQHHLNGQSSEPWQVVKEDFLLCYLEKLTNCQGFILAKLCIVKARVVH